MSDTNTDKPIAGGADVTPADGRAAGSEEVSTIHQVLSTALGKDFKDDDSALKAVKDTFAYVGKVGKFAPKLDALQQKLGGESKLLETIDAMINQPETQASQPEVVDTSKFVTRDEMQREQFYQNNPDYKPYQSIIDAMVKAEGKTPAEVVASDSFKPLFEKAKTADDNAKDKSVLHSNPRLGAVTDKMNQAGEAAKSGNFAAGADLVTSAVIDAFPGLTSKE